MSFLPESIGSLLEKGIIRKSDESPDGLEFDIDALSGDRRYWGGREPVMATLFYNPADGFARVEENGRYTGPAITCDGSAEHVCAWIEEVVRGE
jgi:hypothetical protein